MEGYAAVSTSEARSETPLLSQWHSRLAPLPDSLHAQIQGSGADQLHFAPQRTGGSFICSGAQNVGAAGLGVLWNLDVHAQSTLTICEFSLLDGTQAEAVTIELPCQAFPAVAAGVCENRITLFILLADCSLICLPLSRLDKTFRKGGDAVTVDEGLLRACTISGIGNLRAPTLLLAHGSHLLIGGESGVLIGFHVHQFLSSGAVETFELQDSSWIYPHAVRTLFSRTQRAGAVAAFPLDPTGSQALIAVVCEDRCVRVWDVINRQRIALLTLEKGQGEEIWTHVQKASTPHPAGAIWTPVSGRLLHAAPGQSLLLVQYEASDNTITRAAMLYALQSTGPSRHAITGRHFLELEVGSELLDAQMSDGLVWVLTAVTAPMGMASSTPQQPVVLLAFSPTGQRFGAGKLADAYLDPLGASKLQQDLVESLVTNAGNAVEVHDVYAMQLLALSTLCRLSLQTALAVHGVHLPRAQLEAYDQQLLRTYLVEAVRMISRKNPGTSTAGCWALLLASYREAWHRAHRPLTLVTCGGELLACVRSGLMIGVLRKCSEAEVLHGSMTSGLQLPSDSQAVYECLTSLHQLTGSLWHSAALAVLLAGADLERAVLPQLEEQLMTGGGPHQGPDLHGFASWRQQRQHLQLTLGRLTQLGPRLPDAIRHFLRVVQGGGRGAMTVDPPASSAPPGAVQPLCPGGSASVVAAAGQAARSQCCLALDLALVLSLLCSGQAAGSSQLGGEVLRLLSAELLPAACSELRLGALLQWLCLSPATVESDNSTGSIPLAQLKLGFAGAAAAPPRPAVRNVASLATRLMPSFCRAAPQLCSQPCSVEAAALQFQVFVHGGPDAAADHHVASRLAGIGYHLLRAREHGALEVVAQLAGSSEHEPSLSLLHGLGLVMRLQAAQGEQRQQLAAAASALLFKAAASIRAGSMGDSLRELLGELQAELLGVPLGSVPAERLQLHFYELASELFAQHGSPEAASAFARAALEQVPSVFPDRSTTDAVAHEGVLWSKLSAWSCEMGRWDEAYAAAASNPMAERALDGVRGIVHLLCDSANLATLCRLPFAGVRDLQRGGSRELVSLVQEAIRCLLTRARNSDVAESLLGYQLLFDFLVARTALGPAAAAMLECAGRLREEGLRTAATVDDLAHTLGCAASCLSLLGDGSQHAAATAAAGFHVSSQPLLGGHRQHRLQLADQERMLAEDRLLALDQLGGGDSMDEGEDEVPRSLEASSSGLPSLAVVQRDLAVAMAAGSLEEATIRSLWEHMGPEEVLSALVQSGQYDEALQLAFATLEGCALRDAVGEVLAAQATACVASTSEAVMMDGIASVDEESASHRWRKLRERITCYCEQEPWFPALLPRIAGALLAARPGITLPPWLVPPPQASSEYQGMAGCASDPAAMLQLYMRHGRLPEAVELLGQHSTAWDATPPISRQRGGAVWFPYSAVAMLQKLVQERARGGRDGQLERLRQANTQLESILQRHVRTALSDSSLLAPAVGPISMFT